MLNTPHPTSDRHSVRKNCCPPFKAYFRLTPGKRLRLLFLKRHLPKEVLAQHFGKGYFEMPYALEVPKTVLLRLGIPAYKIHSGTYPILEDRDFIKVDF
jgi:hypothetical protein